MPKQSKFLLNIICSTDNAIDEIRGKIQCISSGQTALFTNVKELHEFILNEIHSFNEEIESGQADKEENSMPTGIDQYPVIDYSKEL
ncbi:MAG: hypothetical protein P4L50_03035 [Anaerolineaceae bacterium]|nr:hypothetical protein [Anaerolineaceae bacterium]